MCIKSYFANRVAVAVERAQRELGEDAILLSTRLTEGEAREFGKYEVVFGTNAPVDPPDITSEMGDSPEDEFLKRELDAIGDRAPEWSEDTLPAAPWPRMTSPAPTRLALPRPKSPVVFDPIGPPGVIAVVGPGGAGKTSALMKLAFILSAVRGARIRCVQFDTDRLAAIEPMRTFCEILDVPLLMRNVITPNDLRPSTATEYVLVDTPGFAPGDGNAPSRLAEILGTLPGHRTHLVLPAWYSPAELPAIIRRFAPFAADHLLVTRADEISNDATVSALATSCQLPLSLVSASRHASAGFINATHLLQLSARESAA
jgi:flagellar biosynthesis protein FlhF